MNHQRLANRRMTEIPSFSIELYLKGKTKEVSTHPQTPLLTKRSPDENSDSYLERIQHKLRDRRRSTPAISFGAKPVIKHCPTLSESFNRLALGNINMRQIRPFVWTMDITNEHINANNKVQNNLSATTNIFRLSTVLYKCMSCQTIYTALLLGVQSCRSYLYL